MIDWHPFAEHCQRCNATAWEHIGGVTTFSSGRSRDFDIVECVFCGIRMRVDAVPVNKPHADTSTFRFQYGRFKGLTIAEADAEPNGRRYLEHLRETNDKLRGRIGEYLTAAASSA